MKAKFIYKIVLALVLTSSLLAPTVASIINISTEKVTFLDLSDEENNSENEKKYDEKELFFEKSQQLLGILLPQEQNFKSLLGFLHQTVTKEILLPPPETNSILS
ncbi:hypothetical protein GCM10011414_04150 [Croceivirga lutea]|uniref:hypothetical protein n=1 Tax=Croceivirga lutea TaxID=1775167 RepID=UPI001639F710|nr:hypothetical protein [Croceivirga lutea]GGG37999.1 hypothetical protein GCM10011414_04150 [Croceivirga lutea]